MKQNSPTPASIRQDTRRSFFNTDLMQVCKIPKQEKNYLILRRMRTNTQAQ